MITPRTLQHFLERASATFPVILLTGPRQVGKTTLLRAMSGPQRRYICLDDPLALALAREDPATFVERHAPPVLIDEIQYAPGLLSYIKLAVDSNRTPGGYWLTGSQIFRLMRGVAETLAGRVAVVRLAGFSRREAEGRGLTPKRPFLPSTEAMKDYCGSSAPLSLSALYRLIWQGSYPALYVKPIPDWALFYGSYVQTYLERDVRDLAAVGDMMAFLRFLRATAARTGQLLNMAELARDVDVSPNTIKSWLSVLEASGLLYLLPPWHANTTKRLVKTPKLYFLDTGLACYLTRWSSPESLEAGAFSGAIFETWVMGELLKSYWHRGLEAPFFYYRDKDQKEIDLLIEQNGILYPVEIKKTATPRGDALRLPAALGRGPHRLGQGAVLCTVAQALPLSRETLALPVACL